MTFLIESILISGAGGVLGLAIGVTIVVVVVLVSPLPFVVPAWSVITSLLLSCGVGVVFGVSPALRAARLDPIVALRSG
jgi:putative ABC transport system permease protein